MMDKKLKIKLYDYINRLENLRVMVAIRKGYIMTIPITILGAMALVIQYFPNENYQKWLNGVWGGRIVRIITVYNAATLGCISLCLVLTISLAYIQICNEKTYNIIAMPFVSLTSYLTLINVSRADFSIVDFHSEGMFIALACSVISCELYLFIINLKFIKKRINTTGVDTLLAGIIKSLIPAVIIVTIFTVFREIVIQFFDQDNIRIIFADLIKGVFDGAGNNLKTSIVFVISVHLMWMFGVHGNNVLGDVNTYFNECLQKNIDLVSKGMEPTEIINKSMIDCFVLMGGTGTILCIVIATLLFIKKKGVRSVCKFGLIPVVFNISEIITFGLPIVLNPILFIPFIIVPTICFFITYFAMYMGIVPIVIKNVYWTTPVFISGYEATGSVKGVILQIILLAIGVAIYLPFLKVHANNIEKMLLDGVKELKEELIFFENTNKQSNFLERNDRLGEVAKMLANDLKYDVENEKLFVAYQPQVDQNGEYIGAEALIRWNHPSIGFVYPPLIIALAKETKILNKLEKILLKDVCTNIKFLEDNYKDVYKISANITAESLRYEKFEEMVDKAIEKSGIDRTHLWFEITEQDAVTSNEGIIDKLIRLKEKGHKLLIDDFGMGHTSMIYLQTNLFDYVKLDGSITRNVLSNERNSEIISSIVYLSQTLKFSIISEYVEDEEQKNKLYELGCNIYQGYLYSKPVRFSEFITQLDKNREETK